MLQLRISPQADADLQSIHDYIAQNRPSAARRVAKAIERTLRFLTRNPLVGTACGEIRPGLHAYVAEPPADRYVVFFYAERAKGFLEIAAIIDGSRDWQTMLAGSDD